MANVIIRLSEATGRQNYMRFFPWGNADAAPPTSGENITAGSWVLYGHSVA